MMIIFWTLFKHKDWQFILAATEQGLCFTGSDGKDEHELLEWASKRRKGQRIERNDEKMKPYIKQFQEYFDGERISVETPLDLKRTDFQQQVWQVLREIPFGQTQCYSDIALAINNPKAVRAVGTAIGANPVMVIVPCHRVIGKDGSLTGFRGGLPMKQRLLQLEGKK